MGSFGFCFLWLHCAACGIPVPPPGIEPTPTAVEAESLNHWTAREVPAWAVLTSSRIHAFCPHTVERTDSFGYGNQPGHFSPGLSFITCKTAERALNSMTVRVPFSSVKQRLCDILGSRSNSSSEAARRCSRRPPHLLSSVTIH